MRGFEREHGVLKSERIDALLVLLEDMTDAVNTNTAFAASKHQRNMEYYLMFGFVATLVMLVAIAAWHHSGADAFMENSPLSLFDIYRTWRIIAICYVVTVIIGMMMALRQHCQKGFIHLLSTDTTTVESALLMKLLAFDKTTLAFGLVHYQRLWGIFDGRFSVFIADIRKLLIFPPVLVASISVIFLLEESDNAFLWSTLSLLCCGCLMAFYRFAPRERPEQVMALLEFSVCHQPLQSCPLSI